MQGIPCLGAWSGNKYTVAGCRNRPPAAAVSWAASLRGCCIGMAGRGVRAPRWRAAPVPRRFSFCLARPNLQAAAPQHHITHKDASTLQGATARVVGREGEKMVVEERESVCIWCNATRQTSSKGAEGGQMQCACPARAARFCWHCEGAALDRGVNTEGAQIGAADRRGPPLSLQCAPLCSAPLRSARPSCYSAWLRVVCTRSLACLLGIALRSRCGASSRPRRRRRRRAPPRCAAAGCTWRGAPSGTARPS